MGSLELRWGLIIGAANLVWLFGSYYLGMHDGRLGLIWAMMLIGLLITVTGYVLALRAYFQKFPETEYRESLRTGAIMVGVVALSAVFTQLIYLTLINPGWTAHMAEITRLHYLANGTPEAEAAEIAAAAETTYGLGSYLIQAALGAIFVGMICCAIISAFLIRKRSA